MRLKYLFTALSVIAILSIGTANAQNTATLYFMDEIAERNNMNPALTPNCKFYIDLPVLPNFYLNAGINNLMLRDLIFNKNGVTQTFLNNQANRDKFFKTLRPYTSINTYFGLNILSFGFQIQKRHFITFDAGLQADINAYIPRDIFKLAIYGTPDENGVNSFNLNSLGIDATIYSNVSVGYMNVINPQWTVGGKVKFLMGYANISTNINTLTLDASRQNWTLNTNARINASLPITYSTNEDGGLDMNSIGIQNTSELLSLIYTPAGVGAAIDLGFTYKPIKDLTISAAVTDLGFLHWNRNFVSGNMQGTHQIDGFIDYNAGDSINTDAIIDNLIGLGEDIVGTIHVDEGKKYTSMIHANFTVGAEYGILKNKISFGALNRLRFNNSHVSDELTISANFRPLHWLKASLSYSFIDGRWGNIGLGFNIRAGMFNMYIIADYIPVSWAEIASAEQNLNLPLPYRTQRVNLQAGMAWNIGRHANDPDNDGVFRYKDRCPDTDMDFLRKQCPELKKKKEFVDKKGCIHDSDKDGVHDCYDQCPNTPEGVQVDSVGCPLDGDKDGVPDYLDKCPDTPEGVIVDANGCPIDTDSDGVVDYLDKCPNNPEGVEVDENGCPVDTDSDGVADYLDMCPDTPEGVEVDANGCPVDTDGDGVADYIDKCPDTQKGIEVDANGCPLDSDGDGVLDHEDKCPNKPGPVSNYGCPELKREVRNLFKKAMTGIQFQTGKDIILKKSYPILDDVVKVLVENPEYRLIISGHTDNVGKPESNLDLSDRRAASVRRYLEEHGIDSTRLSSVGYGDTRPIADNKTSKGRAQNRRVEFEVVYEEVSIVKDVNPELQGIMPATTDSVPANTSESIQSEATENKNQ